MDSCHEQAQGNLKPAGRSSLQSLPRLVFYVLGIQGVGLAWIGHCFNSHNSCLQLILNGLGEMRSLALDMLDKVLHNQVSVFKPNPAITPKQPPSHCTPKQPHLHIASTAVLDRRFCPGRDPEDGGIALSREGRRQVVGGGVNLGNGDGVFVLELGGEVAPCGSKALTVSAPGVEVSGGKVDM